MIDFEGKGFLLFAAKIRGFSFVLEIADAIKAFGICMNKSIEKAPRHEPHVHPHIYLHARMQSKPFAGSADHHIHTHRAFVFGKIFGQTVGQLFTQTV